MNQKKIFLKYICNYSIHNTKIYLFILIILPIINSIFNGYFFAKYMGLLINNLTNYYFCQNILIKISIVIILLQLSRYIQNITLGKFLTKMNFQIKIQTMEFFTQLHIDNHHIKSNAYKVENLSNNIIEFCYIFFTLIYKQTINIIILIISLLFINKTLSKIFIIYIIFFIIILYFLINQILYNSNEYNKIINNNLIFLNNIANNFFLEKLLMLRHFTLNIFKDKLHMENNYLLTKFNILSISNMICNLLSAISCIICMFIIFTTLQISIENKIILLTLVQNFFNTLNDLPNNIIPLFNSITKIIENFHIFNESISITNDNYHMNDITHIKLENIRYHYNQKLLFHNLNVEFKKGINIIHGISGKGKSTLIKIVSSLLQPKNGNIYFNNINIKDKNILMYISYMCQNDFIYDRTVYENIYLNKTNQNNLSFIKDFNMEHLLHENTNNLSGGELKRLNFLRILHFYKDGNVVILDEPFNGLDENLILIMIKYITELATKSIVIIIDHQKIIEKHSIKIKHNIYLS